MKLRVTAEDAPKDKTRQLYHSISASNIGIARAISIPAATAHHVVAENIRGEIRLGCAVDCESGDIGVAMKDDRSALVRLEQRSVG